jgi:plasmid stabilization system protein ParE
MGAFIIMPQAKRQLRRAMIWWLDNRDKAPWAFVEEFDETLSLIVENPTIGQPVRGRRPGMRRTLLERVRYYLYYRVNANGDVEVLSVWHASRRPPRL